MAADGDPARANVQYDPQPRHLYTLSLLRGIRRSSSLYRVGLLGRRVAGAVGCGRHVKGMPWLGRRLLLDRVLHSKGLIWLRDDEHGDRRRVGGGGRSDVFVSSCAEHVED